MLCTDVEKRFYVYEHRTESLREVFRRSVLRRPLHVRHARFAIEGLSLRIERGESVVLLGRNGSGKSTTLRLMAGIYAPTAGTIGTHGRVTAVIELGAGFQPELTGEENIALYGAILGLDRHRLAERYDEIVAFAALGDFIATPVKYYSSGMRARLAFAVAVSARPDVLLLDEVLVVGDLWFKERCLERLAAFHDAGGTLVVASHDLDTTRTLCTRAIWLDDGRIVMDGDLETVFAAYGAAVATPPAS